LAGGADSAVPLSPAGRLRRVSGGMSGVALGLAREMTKTKAIERSKHRIII
jgi:hypothetical protein